jgi:DNA-binding MarR family transcriptional regulator
MFRTTTNGEPTLYLSQEDLLQMYKSGMAKKEFYILMAHRSGGLDEHQIAKNLGLLVKSIKKAIRKLKKRGELLNSRIEHFSQEEIQEFEALERANDYFFGEGDE